MKNFKTDYPKIPWAEARGMRNILIHEYFRVNQKEVWATVKESIPELKTQISEILKNLKSGK